MRDQGGQCFRHVGTTLVLVRELLGRVRQAECARRAGVTRAQLSRYETEGAAPTLETLGKVLEALEVRPAEFFTAMAAVDLLAVGEESLESIRRRILERQRTVLNEFLAGLARLREGGSAGGEDGGSGSPRRVGALAVVLAAQATKDETGGGPQRG